MCRWMSGEYRRLDIAANCSYKSKMRFDTKKTALFDMYLESWTHIKQRGFFSKFIF